VPLAELLPDLVCAVEALSPAPLAPASPPDCPCDPESPVLCASADEALPL